MNNIYKARPGNQGQVEIIGVWQTVKVDGKRRNGGRTKPDDAWVK